MRDLVSNGVEDVLLPVSGEVLISLNVVIVVSDAAYVLHGTHGVIGAHDRIQFVKRIWLVEHLLVVADRGLCDSEPVILHLFAIFGQRLTAEKFHRHVWEFGCTLWTRVKTVERTRHESIEIGRYLFCSLEFVHLDLVAIKLRKNWRVCWDFEALEGSLNVLSVVIERSSGCDA